MSGIVLTVLDHIIKQLLIVYADTGAYSVNTGVALSIFARNEEIAFSLSIFALMTIGYVLWRDKFHLGTDESRVLSLVLIAGIGNMIDRFIWGGVVDYIPFFGLFTCNLSDIVITVSVCLLLFIIFFRKTAVRI